MSFRRRVTNVYWSTSALCVVVLWLTEPRPRDLWDLAFDLALSLGLAVSVCAAMWLVCSFLNGGDETPPPAAPWNCATARLVAIDMPSNIGVTGGIYAAEATRRQGRRGSRFRAHRNDWRR